MRLNCLASLLFLGCCGVTAAASAQTAAAPPAPACPALLQQQFNRLQDDVPQNLC